MLGRVIKKCIIAAACLSAGTVIAQIVGVAYLNSKGAFEKEKFVQIMAILYGIDVVGIRQTARDDQMKVNPEQASFGEIEMARAMKFRYLELREQSLATDAAMVKSELTQLQAGQNAFQAAKSAYEQQLAEDRDGVLAAGRENVRALWESMRPAQAKDQILKMYDDGDVDEVVKILSAMPTVKLAKIASEFKNGAEPDTLAEITRLIREGEPNAALIDDTQQQLGQPAPAGI